MADLNSEIIAYLSVNKIAYTAGDYQTGQPEGQADQVLIWNTTKLGTQPTQAQLDSAYTTYQAQLTAQAQAQEAVKASALAKLTALGLTADEIKAITGA
jgi:hypothetical protein